MMARRAWLPQATEKAAQTAKRPVVHASLIQGTIAGLNLVAGVIAARLLSLDERGSAAALVSTLSLTVYLMDIGAAPALQFYVARHKVVTLATWRETGLLVVVITSLVAVAVMRLIFPFDISTVTTICLFTFAIANIVGRWSNALLIGKHRFNEANRNRLAQTLIWVLALWVCLLVDASADSYVIAFTISWVCQAVLAQWSLRHDRTSRRALQGRPVSMQRGFWRYALAAHLAAQNVFDAWRIEIVLGAFIFAESDLALLVIAGSYGAQVRILAIALGPIVNVRAAAGATKARMLAELRVFVPAIAGLGVVLGGLAFIAIPLLFGAQYTASVPMAVLYCVAAVASSVRSLLSDWLRGVGNPNGPLFVEVTVAGVFGTCWLAIPDLTVTGVAALVLVCQSVGMCIAAVAVWRQRDA